MAVCSLGLACLAPHAAAQTRSCAGASFPTTVQVEGTTLQLNGLGLREVTFLNIDVYVAALYVTKPSRSAKAFLSTDAPTRVVLRLSRDVSTEQLQEELETGLENNAPQASTAKKRKLFSLLEPLSEGDTLTFTYVPGRGLELQSRGTVKGRVPGLDFARAILSTLIGVDPIDDAVKKGLLGGPCG